MLFNNLFHLLLFLIIYVVSVTVGFSENTSCVPNRLILLSNCSFNSAYSKMTMNHRTLSMIVSYVIDNQEEENSFIRIVTRDVSQKPLISFNLNIIQCSTKNPFNWTSVESSLTLRGEFVRTTLTDTNIMYLSSGITYLRNLTTVDCSTKTMYRTNLDELFQVNLKIESTLDDYCSKEHLCYPSHIYQCDVQQHRCACRSSFQSYVIRNKKSICIQAVENIDQCTTNDLRCVEWCQSNRSSLTCICPTGVSEKKFLDTDRAYCEGQTNGLCNSFVQCPLGDICVRGTCQNANYKLHHFMSFDIATISIIVASLILFVIIIFLGIRIYILRRHRWKKHYHSSIDSVHKRQQQANIPATSNYDNIIYGVFHNKVQLPSTLLSSSDDNIDDNLPFNKTDSSAYHPKIVFLGGEEQLTAIYA